MRLAQLQRPWQVQMRTTAANTTMTAMAMMIVARGVIKVRSSQLEEQAVTPWEDKVESRTTEERTDHHEYSPEHEVHGHD